MKTLKRFDTAERLVTLFDMEDGTYQLSIISNVANGGKVYKSKYYAELGFKTWRDYPLEIIQARYVD